MKRNDTFSSDDDDSRDGREYVVDQATRDMTKMELRILVSKLKDRCNEGESKLKKLTLELHLLKSKGRNTKQKIRSDFCWDGEDANLADKITHWVKTFLFPRYKFLKNGWMVFSEDEESLSAFVRRHNHQSIPRDADYEDLWERVICPVIQGKYVSIHCNLANDIRTTFKGECQE
jgi:hypothetical protein